jgi:hypothetical protein
VGTHGVVRRRKLDAKAPRSPRRCLSRHQHRRRHSLAPTVHVGDDRAEWTARRRLLDRLTEDKTGEADDLVTVDREEDAM